MKLTYNVTLDFKTTLELNEMEVGALTDLVGYGIDPFLKVFYEKLGKAYMREHEQGLRSLFETIGNELPSVLYAINNTKKDIKKIRDKKTKPLTRPNK